MTNSPGGSFIGLHGMELSQEVFHESKEFGKEDLRALQDHSTAGDCTGHL
jgi:hypothetical protein